MHKSEFLKAIRECNLNLLKKTLLTNESGYLTTYAQPENSETEISRVWLGDYLHHLVVDKKITIDQFYSLLTLSDEQGRSWLYFLNKGEAKYCKSMLKILDSLYVTKILPKTQYFKLLFSQSDNGWIFSTAIALNKEDSLTDLFLDSLSSLPDEDALDIVHGLSIKIDKNRNFFHCISYKNNEDLFKKFLDLLAKLILVKDVPSSSVMGLLTAKNSSEYTGFDYIPVINVDVFFNFFNSVSQNKDVDYYVQVLNLFTYCSPNRPSLFYNSLAGGFEKQLCDLLDIFLKQNSTVKVNKVVEVTAELLFRDSTPNKLLFLLQKGKNLHEYLVEYFIKYLELNDYLDSSIKYEYLDKIFIEDITGGRTHLQNFILNNVIAHRPNLDGNGIPTTSHLEKLIKLYRFLLRDNSRLITTKFFKFITHDNGDGWTALKLAAGYLSPADFKIFINFVLEIIMDKFSKTDEGKDRSHVTSFLYSEFEEKNDDKPSLISLLLRHQRVNFVYFLNAIKKFTLHDRQLRFLLLEEFLMLGNFIPNTEDYHVLISAHIEMLYPCLKNLTKAEIKMLEDYSALNFDSANFLLFIYQKSINSLSASDYFAKLSNTDYWPFLLYSCIDEIKKSYLLLPLTRNLCKKFSSMELLAKIKEYHHFFDALDLVKLLERCLSFYKEKDELYYEIAMLCYEHPDLGFVKAKDYFLKISTDRRVLSSDQHYDVFICLLNIAEKFPVQIVEPVAEEPPVEIAEIVAEEPAIKIVEPVPEVVPERIVKLAVAPIPKKILDNHVYFIALKHNELVVKIKDEYMDGNYLVEQSAKEYPVPQELFALNKAITNSKIKSLIDYFPAVVSFVFGKLNTGADQQKYLDLCTLLLCWMNLLDANLVALDDMKSDITRYKNIYHLSKDVTHFFNFTSENSFISKILDTFLSNISAYISQKNDEFIAKILHEYMYGQDLVLVAQAAKEHFVPVSQKLFDLNKAIVNSEIKPLIDYMPVLTSFIFHKLKKDTDQQKYLDMCAMLLGWLKLLDADVATKNGMHKDISGYNKTYHLNNDNSISDDAVICKTIDIFRYNISQSILVQDNEFTTKILHEYMHGQDFEWVKRAAKKYGVPASQELFDLNKAVISSEIKPLIDYLPVVTSFVFRKLNQNVDQKKYLDLCIMLSSWLKLLDATKATIEGMKLEISAYEKAYSLKRNSPFFFGSVSDDGVIYKIIDTFLSSIGSSIPLKYEELIAKILHQYMYGKSWESLKRAAEKHFLPVSQKLFDLNKVILNSNIKPLIDYMPVFTSCVFHEQLNDKRVDLKKYNDLFNMLLFWLKLLEAGPVNIDGEHGMKNEISQYEKKYINNGNVNVADSVISKIFTILLSAFKGEVQLMALESSVSESVLQELFHLNEVIINSKLQPLIDYLPMLKLVIFHKLNDQSVARQKYLDLCNMLSFWLKQLQTGPVNIEVEYWIKNEISQYEKKYMMDGGDGSNKTISKLFTIFLSTLKEKVLPVDLDPAKDNLYTNRNLN